MTPVELARTIYLGDRICKKIVLDTWSEQVEVQVDCISRIRSASGFWEFYSEEDISDGKLVFTDVRSFGLTPSGWLPNDMIDVFRITEKVSGGFEVTFEINSVSNDSRRGLVVVTMHAEGFFLIDPRSPDAVIDS